MPTKVTPHFTVEEFQRRARPDKGFPDAAPYPKAWVASRLRPLCELLEVLRAELGAPIKVGSGYRDPAYNKSIGGAKASQHMAGRAADITVAGISPARVHAKVLALYEMGRLPSLGGLGSYETFTHVDIRSAKRLVRWTGSRKEN
jgi:uncharacterized protein YcbK (DUF882 family)